MAKTTFTKLALKKNDNIQQFEYNENIIEVKQYLPINDKIEMITRIIQNSHNPDVNYPNPIILNMMLRLEIVYNYSNITFTEKQKSDVTKLYDLLNGNGIIDSIIMSLPEQEYQLLIYYLNETVKSIYDYQSSVLGILESVSQDYSNLELDATKIQKALADPDNLNMLKTVLTKLG